MWSWNCWPAQCKRSTVPLVTMTVSACEDLEPDHSVPHHTALQMLRYVMGCIVTSINNLMADAEMLSIHLLINNLPPVPTRRMKVIYRRIPKISSGPIFCIYNEEMDGLMKANEWVIPWNHHWMHAWTVLSNGWQINRKVEGKCTLKLYIR